LVKLDNVTFAYKNSKTPIVKELSLHIKSGEKLWLTGASGCGKTTVLRLIMGLERPKKGSVTLKEGAKISAVFQEDRLIPGISVLENVALFSESEERAISVLSELGLGEEPHLAVSELSGGMKRRVAVARALARNSDILILDEAMTGLDDENKKNTAGVINKYTAGRTVIAVTHDSREAELLGVKALAIF